MKHKGTQGSLKNMKHKGTQGSLKTMKHKGTQVLLNAEMFSTGEAVSYLQRID